jgi:hypothetical protein
MPFSKGPSLRPNWATKGNFINDIKSAVNGMIEALRSINSQAMKTMAFRKTKGIKTNPVIDMNHHLLGLRYPDRAEAIVAIEMAIVNSIEKIRTSFKG